MGTGGVAFAFKKRGVTWHQFPSAADNIDTMNRSDIVDDLAAKFGNLTKGDTEFAVNTILDAMADALVAGHRIEIRGFGSFSVTRRPPRIGRNPRNGESVAIPEKRVVHFKPGKALRESAENSTADSKTDTGKTVAAR